MIEAFIKNYNEKSDEGYFLKVDVQYLKKSHKLHNAFQFLLEIMKIEKVKKIVANLHESTEYVIHIRNLKHLLNHGLVLKKVKTIYWNKYWSGTKQRKMILRKVF